MPIWLGYNLHTIKCTHFKSTYQWVLTKLYICETTTMRYKYFYHSQKLPCAPSQTAKLPSPVWGNHCFAIDLDCFFLESHTNESTQCILFCFQLFSLNILLGFNHAILFLSPFLFIVEYSIVWIYHNLFINSSISDLPGVSSLRLLQIKLLWTLKWYSLGGDIFEGTTEIYGKCMLNFMRNCKTVF